MEQPGRQLHHALRGAAAEGRRKRLGQLAEDYGQRRGDHRAHRDGARRGHGLRLRTPRGEQRRRGPRGAGERHDGARRAGQPEGDAGQCPDRTGLDQPGRQHHRQVPDPAQEGLRRLGFLGRYFRKRQGHHEPSLPRPDQRRGVPLQAPRQERERRRPAQRGPRHAQPGAGQDGRSDGGGGPRCGHARLDRSEQRHHREAPVPAEGRRRQLWRLAEHSVERRRRGQRGRLHGDEADQRRGVQPSSATGRCRTGSAATRRARRSRTSRRCRLCRNRGHFADGD